jgi:hypothetical protein
MSDHSVAGNDDGALSAIAICIRLSPHPSPALPDALRELNPTHKRETQLARGP